MGRSPVKYVEGVNPCLEYMARFINCKWAGRIDDLEPRIVVVRSRMAVRTLRHAMHLLPPTTPDMYTASMAVSYLDVCMYVCNRSFCNSVGRLPQRCNHDDTYMSAIRYIIPWSCAVRVDKGLHFCYAGSPGLPIGSQPYIRRGRATSYHWYMTCGSG